jgi:hypothetical protein
MKLYKVKCRGMHGGMASSTAHGIAYVVAANPDEAYQMVRRHLDKSGLGFEYERELESVELMADEGEYPKCGHRLYVKRSRSAQSETDD